DRGQVERGEHLADDRQRAAVAHERGAQRLLGAEHHVRLLVRSIKSGSPMSNTRSNRKTSPDKDALDMFAQEPMKDRAGHREVRDFGDMMYPDAFARETEDELPWPEVSADAMRRLAFIEWKRRLFRIAFAGSLLAFGLFVWVVLQRFPLPFSWLHEEPPHVAANADTSPVPSPPETAAET